MRRTSLTLGTEHPAKDYDPRRVSPGEDVEDEGGFDPSQRSCAQRLRWFLATTKVGVILEITNIALSIISCTTYIVETYHLGPRLFVAIIIEAVTVAYFSAYFLLGLMAAERKMLFLLRWFSLIDVVCIVPVVVITHDTEEHNWVLVVRLVSVVRILYVFQIHRFFQNEIGRQIFFLAYNFLSVTYVSASIIEYVENQPEFWIEDEGYEQIPFHDCYYFIFTTLTTIGYGDIVPRTQFGRMTIVGMMAVSLLTIPKRTNKLISLLAQQSPYVKSSFSGSKESQHIIVCGSISSSSTSNNSGGLIPFFLEFFHEDHGVVDRNAAVLAQGHPSQEMILLLSDPKYSTGIAYLEGDVLDDNDLRRASAERAKAAFVLCDKFSTDKDAEDASTILRALSLKRYVFRKSEKDINVFVQLIRPENKQLFLSAAGSFSHSMRQLTGQVSADPEEDKPTYKHSGNVAVCVEELKYHLLSQSCLCPGLTTLVFNLVATNSVDESALAGRSGGGEWMKEYIWGAGKEIYRIPLSIHFEGLTFLQACKIVYQETGCIMFALEVNIPKLEPRIILNPVNLPLPDCIMFGLYGFVMAEDKREADIITTLGGRGRRGGVVQKSAGIRNVFSEVLTRQKKWAVAQGAYAPSIPTSPSQHPLLRPQSSPNMAASEPPAAPENLSSLPPADPGPSRSRTRGCCCCRGSSTVRPRLASTADIIDRVRTSNLEHLVEEEKETKKQANEGKVADTPAAASPTASEETNLSFGSRSKGKALLFKAAVKQLRRPPKARVNSILPDPTLLKDPAPAWLPAGPILTLSQATVLSIYAVERTQEPRESKPAIGLLPSASAIARGSYAQTSTIRDVMTPSLDNNNMKASHPGLFRPCLCRSLLPSEGRSETVRRKASASHIWEDQRRDSQPLAKYGASPPSTGSKVECTANKEADLELESLILSNAPFSTKLPVFRNHVIICCGGGGTLPELHHFIRPLRASYLQEPCPVVILHPTPPTAQQWAQLTLFGDVWYIKGSPLEGRDMKRAGVHVARAMVVFANSSLASIHVADDHAWLLDADGVCIYTLATAENPNLEIICEVADQSRITYLSTNSASGQELAAPQFAAGRVYSPAMLDVILSQAFYNNHIVTILERLVVGADEEQVSRWTKQAASFFPPVSDSSITLINIPPAFYGRTFGELFTWLIDSCGILPMAMRRASAAVSEKLKRIWVTKSERSASTSSSSSTSSYGSQENDSPQPPQEPQPTPNSPVSPLTKLPEQLPVSEWDLPNLGNTMAYVYTNPPKEAILRPGDGVYSLAQEVPERLFQGFWVPGVPVPQRISPYSRRKSSLRSTSSTAYKPNGGVASQDEVDNANPRPRTLQPLAKVTEEHQDPVHGTTTTSDSDVVQNDAAGTNRDKAIVTELVHSIVKGSDTAQHLESKTAGGSERHTSAWGSLPPINATRGPSVGLKPEPESTTSSTLQAPAPNTPEPTSRETVERPKDL